MKFKYADKQNEKIKAITEGTLVIGCDIAKATHVARAFDLIQRVETPASKGGVSSGGVDSPPEPPMFQLAETSSLSRHRTRKVATI